MNSNEVIRKAKELKNLSKNQKEILRRLETTKILCNKRCFLFKDSTKTIKWKDINNLQGRCFFEFGLSFEEFERLFFVFA